MCVKISDFELEVKLLPNKEDSIKQVFSGNTLKVGTTVWEKKIKYNKRLCLLKNFKLFSLKTFKNNGG